MIFSSVPYGNRLEKTIELGQAIADKWGKSPLFVKLARRIKTEWNAQTKVDEARAIQSWVQNRVRYFSDPHGAELVGEPFWVMQNGGDCDDLATLAATLLIALGHNARIAAVMWEGKTDFSHAVAADLTANCVVDPVSTPPEIWPPATYTVKRMIYMKPTGEIADLSGLFGKLFKAIAKPFTKIFKPKTLLGKIMDPLGLASRNAKWGYKIADVVGTAATLAVGGWAIGAAAGGAGGFWSTAALGAKTVGVGALKAATALKTGVVSAGKFIAPAVVSALANKEKAPAVDTTMPGLPDYSGQGPGYETGFGAGSGGGYSGGGGGGPYVDPNEGTYTDASGTLGKTVEVTEDAGTNMMPILAIGAAAVGLYFLTAPKKRGKK